MTDYEKLMDLLKVSKETREELFYDLVKRNITLYLDFSWDGSITWGTMN